MKTTLLLQILAICLTTPCFAQLDTIFYDANWSICTKNQASYFRPPPIEKDKGYWVIDHYISGEKQMEAFSLKPSEDTFDGFVTYYYKNGNVQQTVTFKNNLLQGARKDYYLNGRLKDHSIYDKGKRNGLWISYYENSNISETGNYSNDEREGYWKEFHPNGKLKAEGVYIKGKKIGDWKMYFYDGENNN
ncbi:toxin-antitoxin system YwqK family antitoxin [Flavobacteriaceae bacterium F08102]|nr:toxin-antitoxin system YwqK family antitoxin [Flavobacteriaceae bacterium F08102]